MAGPADTVEIRLVAAAPSKPGWGAACNGCGVCCAAQPCPLSRLLLRHRTGSCPALRWHAASARYVCGMATAPGDYLDWLPSWSAALSRRMALRWIAAGRGCDFDAEVIDADAA